MEELDRLGWAVQHTFEVGGRVFGVRTTSKELGEWIGETFKAYRIDDEDIGAMYAVVVAGDDDHVRFNVLYKGSFIRSRSEDIEEIKWALRAEFESYAFVDWDGGIYLDATPMSYNGTTALLPNEDMHELHHVYRAIARAGVSMPPGGRIAADLESAQAIPIPPRLKVPESAFNGSVAAAASQIDVFCAGLDLGRDDLHVPIPSRVLAVQNIGRAIVNFEGLGPKRALQGLARFIGDSPCYEVGRGSPRWTLEALLALLGEEHPAEIAG